MALVSVHREKSLQYSRHYQGKLIFHYSCFPGEGLPWSSTAPAASASTFTHFSWASLVAQRLKRLPALQVTWVQSLGREDTLEKEMATHSGLLFWKIPWTEEAGGLQSIASQGVRQWWLHNRNQKGLRAVSGSLAMVKLSLHLCLCLRSPCSWRPVLSLREAAGLFQTPLWALRLLEPAELVLGSWGKIGVSETRQICCALPTLDQGALSGFRNFPANAARTGLTVCRPRKSPQGSH